MLVRRVVGAALLLAAACAGPIRMQPPAPGRTSAVGDVETFGHPIVAVEEAGRYLDLFLNRPVRLFVYSVDRANNLRTLVACRMSAGAHRVAPTITSGRIINAFPSGGGAQRGWSFRPGEESFLVMLIAEERPVGPHDNCNVTGDGAVSYVMPVREAMESLPVQLREFPTTPWVSYLIAM